MFKKNTKKVYLLIILIVLAISLPLLYVGGADPIGGELEDPTGKGSFEALLNAVADFLRIIGIPLSVLAVLWAALLFMTAGGNEEKVTKAKQALTWAIIGMAIILIGTGLTSVIKDLLGIAPVTP